jgi:hypothetical protein
VNRSNNENLFLVAPGKSRIEDGDALSFIG